MRTPPHLRLERVDGFGESAEERAARLTRSLGDTEEVLRLLDQALQVATERHALGDRIVRLKAHRAAFKARREALQTELLHLRLSDGLPGGFWAIDGRRA